MIKSEEVLKILMEKRNSGVHRNKILVTVAVRFVDNLVSLISAGLKYK
jgi:hypothetical protein